MTQDKPEPADDLADDLTAQVPPDPAGPPPTPPPPPPPSATPPPAAGFPPPGGFPPPPPGTGGWATRYGLVRPAQGRVLVGVAAALGRATNTDPVLWRVLFGVLSLVGGVGIVAYLIGWLLIPAEGDTASPLEALLGRGRSSTSPVIVVLVGIGAILATGSFLFHGPRQLLLVAALIVGAVLLLNRSTGQPPRPASTTPPAFAEPAYPEAAYTAPPPPAYPTGPESTGYRPPFAPYGPYATSPYPYPGLGTPPAPVAPPKPPSRLGRVTLSLVLLVLGVIALIDVVGHGSIPFAGYVAAALATVGVGLLLGAWFGRARGLIPLGIVLSVVLAIATAAGHVDTWRGSTGDVTWAPTSLNQLSDRYEHGFGNADLDLRQLNFDGQDRHVTIRLNAGNLHVELPSKVDVDVVAKVNVGNANVFDSTWDGVNTPRRTVSNDDTDGPGGGHLVLDIQLTAGDLEVNR